MIAYGICAETKDSGPSRAELKVKDVYCTSNELKHTAVRPATGNRLGKRRSKNKHRSKPGRAKSEATKLRGRDTRESRGTIRGRETREQ